MKLLSFETSARTFGISAYLDGKPAGEVFWDCGLHHSEKLVPSLDWMLKQLGWNIHEIDKIGVSTGPGSFTGIRIGLSCARMMSQSLGVPVVGVDTLEVIKQGAVLIGAALGMDIVPVIDALRGEVYSKDAKGKIEIITLEDFIAKLKKSKKEIIVAGSAALVHGKRLEHACGKKIKILPEAYNFPKASSVCELALGVKGRSFKDVKPVYVRRSWAEERQ